MSRTTALKRLGVAALASVTVFGVAPAFTAPAAANHTVTGITLSPDADSAPTGTCNQFTATVTLSNGADTATVDVLAVRTPAERAAIESFLDDMLAALARVGEVDAEGSSRAGHLGSAP